MGRPRRLSAGIAALALVLEAGGARAAAARDLCDRIELDLRRGDAHRAPEDSVLGSIAKAGGLELARTEVVGAEKLRRLNPAPDLAAAFPTGEESVELSWLEPGRVGMINDIQGTLRCSNLTFFRVDAGQAHRVAPPRALRVKGTHLCWTNGARAGAVAGRPALLEEDGKGAPWNVGLQAFPWTGEAWGKPCRLNARFAAELAFDTRHCTAGALCTTLEAEAMRLAKRREYHKPLPPADARFEALTAKTTALEELPAEDETIGYGHFTHPQLADAHQPGVVAVVGGGAIGWRDYPGHIVAFWQATPDGSLTPLAGYQIARNRGALTGVKRLP